MQIEIGNVDWEELRQQKRKVFEVVMKETHQRPHVLDGLLAFIDDIQDQAAANGVPASEVFGTGED